MWTTVALLLVAPFLVAAVTEVEIQELLDSYNGEAIDMCNKVVQASWDVNTHVGEAEFLTAQKEVTTLDAEFRNRQTEVFADIDPTTITDAKLRRQVASLKIIGAAALDADKLIKYTEVRNRMTSTFSNAVICPYENDLCDITGNDVLRLDPDIELILATSTDYKKLQYTWEEFHNKAGMPMRQDYAEFMELSNEAARKNGFKDTTEWMHSSYEELNFDQIEEMWAEVKPLYDELHTFVRNKLTKSYSANAEMRAASPNMPAHILGNMWAQSWTNLIDRVKPFDIDDNLGSVTEEMVRGNYDAKRMFAEADEFFVGLGMPSTSMSFGENADIVDPMPERQIVCHASAWDFCKNNDFRIKMCTNVNLADFQTIHHELGHIAYYQQYADLPILLRGSANPAFHEAVGDAISLAFANTKHLRNIGLLKDNLTPADAEKSEINALFLMALDRVAFLPFGLLIDKWRWDVFNGTVPQEQWNEHWWNLREKYQKIVPPSVRTEEHFDPGAKFHVGAHSQYIGYFFAHLLQFQIYRSMCIEAKQYTPNDPNSAPLHQCVYYGNKAAGQKLMNGLKLGKSEPWPNILEAMTDERTMNGGAIMEYFAPLLKFLRQANREENEELVKRQLSTYSIVASGYCTRLKNAEWDVATDMHSETKKDIFFNMIQSNAKFAKQQYELLFKDLDPNDFDDIDVKRQVMYLNRLGINILPEEKLEERQQTSEAMQLVYNEAVVCPFAKQNCDPATEGMTLNPDIERILDTSDDFEELKYVWSEWYDKTGTHMRKDYKRFIELSNEAAVLNNFKDYGDMLRFNYEDDNLLDNMMKIWTEVEPLYDALHTYVRHKLVDKYGSKMNASDPLIPAHLLGNMWAQSWAGLYNSIKPFQNASDIDVTEKMKEKLSVMQMFEESDRFYKDLGLKSNEMSYRGPLPIIEKPEDRLIICHASAWDFCDGEDFRIKQCTQVQQRDFVTVHHEMGHIQYYIQYAGQPLSFRQGANPGFHEAVGDLIALSVSTPQHLMKINLLEDYKDTEEDNINALLKMALERVAFLPFGLLIDMYRWELFSGAVPENKWNARWEELREKYQKIRSPVPRTELNFDAGAKFHVASDYEYINYFVAHILEFQLHKSFCKVAGQLENNHPLHKCDIDGSKEVGALLTKGLAAGSSRHWSDTLEAMTNDRVLKSDAILEYFKPLMDYLLVENARWERENGEEDTTKPTPDVPTPDDDEEELPMLPIIVGAVLGGGVVVGVIAAVIYYLVKSSRGPGSSDKISA